MKIRYMIFLLVLVFLSVVNACAEPDPCEKIYVKAKTLLSCQDEECIDAAKKAEMLVEPSVSFCRDNLNINNLLTQVKINLGKNREALYYAKRSVNISPGDAFSLHLLGTSCFITGNHERGLELLKKSIDDSNVNDEFVFNYCTSLDYAGKQEEALKICSSLLNSDKYHDEVSKIIEKIKSLK